MIMVRRIYPGLISREMDDGCALANPEVMAIHERAHERQVEMAKAGNPYAQAYLIRCVGLGHLIDGYDCQDGPDA